MKQKITSILLAFILLTGTLTLTLPHAISAQQESYNVTFAGDYTCSSTAANNVKNLKSNNVQLLQGLGDYAYKTDQQCWIDIVNGLPNIKIVMGNHEDSEDGSTSSWTQLVNYFKTKTNPELANGNYYSYQFKSLYVIALNTQASLDSGAQAAFLDAELQKAKQKKEAGEIQYVVIASHKMYMNCALNENLDISGTCGDHRPSEVSGYKNVVNVIYKYADVVDLVTQGHDHNTQVSKNLKLENGKLVVTTKDDKNGVIWGVYGSMGRSLDSLPNVSTKPLWQYLNGAAYQAPIFTVSPDGIVLKFLSSGGNVLFNEQILTSKVQPEPVEPIAVIKPDLIIGKEGQTLSINGLESKNAVSYQWSVTGNSEITSGANSNTAQLLIKGEGDLSLTVKNAEGKSNTAIKSISIENQIPAGKLTPISIIASKEDSGKEAKYSADGDFNTRWSADGKGQWIEFKFGATVPITKVALTGYAYDKSYVFEIGGKTFVNDANRPANELTEYNLESLGIVSDTVRLIGQGNSGSDGNSYREIVFYTGEIAPPPGEICGDGIDNNNNGQIDENCPAEICGDGVDNDSDGKIDEDCDVEEPRDLADNVKINISNKYTPKYDLKVDQKQITIYPTQDDTIITILANSTVQ